jgi:hypothetical protein
MFKYLELDEDFCRQLLYEPDTGSLANFRISNTVNRSFMEMLKRPLQFTVISQVIVRSMAKKLPI